MAQLSPSLLKLVAIYSYFRSYIKESYNIAEQNYPRNQGTDNTFSHNNGDFVSVVDSDDDHVHDVDDLHPLVDHDVVDFLREKSGEVDISDNDNIQAELSKY